MMTKASAGVALAMTVAVVTGCSGEASSGTASASPTAVASSSANNRTSAAVTAYEAMWQDVVKASGAAEYQDPHLADHATGQALTTNRAVIKYDHDHEIVGRGRPVLHPTATALAGTVNEVSIKDCLDDSRWLQYRASGALLNDKPGGRHRVAATVSFAGGEWRVSYLAVGGVGTC